MKYTTYLQIFFIYIALLVLTIIITNQNVNYDFLKIILRISSFVFAILLGFAIANRHKRFTEIRHSLREDDAHLLNIYRFSIVFGKEKQKEIQKLIDNYLVSQIDYKLVDYNKSTYLLTPIYNFTLQLKTDTDIQKNILNKMIDNLQESVRTQKHVIYWLKDKVTILEWISIISLYFIIIGIILFLNDHNIFSSFIVPIIGATLFIPILILYNLNNLTWQNQNWDWKSLTKIFIELDLPPYYPHKLQKIPNILKYLKENDVEKCRTAVYPSKYPTVNDKQVKIIKLK